jgi:DNA-binding response OmpR family regulator
MLDQVTTSPRSSQPKRVLIVEDEALIALMMADQVAELGYIVVGPACTMSQARNLAASAPIDGALLDLNLNGVQSDEIADILSRRQVPFAFVTGYEQRPTGLYQNVDVLHKPFQVADLQRAIDCVVTKHAVNGTNGEEQTNGWRIGFDSPQKL